MTGDDLPLLAAILARPDDDAPRRVYADWLEDHGHPERAAFIRVQIELAKCPPEIRADRRWHDLRYMVAAPWDALRRRERELLVASAASLGVKVSTHGDTFLRFGPTGYATEDQYQIARCFVRRGFIDSLTIPAADWLAHERQLVWHPAAADPCPGCGGDGLRDFERVCLVCRRYDVPRYPNGKSTGSVPRPVPPTAQPVTKVVLTTWPTREEFAARRWRLIPPGTIGQMWSEVIRGEWPWIEIELPHNPARPDYGDARAVPTRR